MPILSRRDFLTSLGGMALLSPLARAPFAGVPRPTLAPWRARSPIAPRGVVVRTITTGVALQRLSDLRAVEEALAVLARARKRFEREGYEVQTTRITLPPRVATLNGAQRSAALNALRAIDQLCAGAGVMCGLGPVLMEDRPDDSIAPWAAELVRDTKATSFSAVIASPARGIHAHGVRLAAAVTRAVAESRPTGMGSFQFAAAANVPPRDAVLPRRLARRPEFARGGAAVAEGDSRSVHWRARPRGRAPPPRHAADGGATRSGAHRDRRRA
jgi:hypothetical protein